MRIHTALLLLGGNLGEVLRSFDQAILRLEDHGSIVAVSKHYRSEAWGMDQAPDFLNQALILETPCDPADLLRATCAIEDELGRTRNDSVGYLSRTLDIDILLMDQLIIDTVDLSIPHPRMHLRSFTMQPAAEIAGDWQHPILKKNLKTLAIECSDLLKVEVI